MVNSRGLLVMGLGSLGRPCVSPFGLLAAGSAVFGLVRLRMGGLHSLYLFAMLHMFVCCSGGVSCIAGGV
jgi:hypothetical protein